MIGSSILFLGLAGGSLWAAFMDPAEELSLRILLAGLGLLFLCGGMYAPLCVFRAKVVLYADRMLIVTPFTTKLLHLNELNGWRTMRNGFAFHCKETRSRTVNMSAIFPLDREFMEWLGHLRCLDLEDAKASERKILDDERLGNTISERNETLEKGLKRTKVLNGVSIVTFLWVLFYPRPYIPLMLVLLALPWVAAEMMRRSNGLVRADEFRNDAHPNVALALLMPGCGLGLRGVLDYDVLGSGLAVIWAVAIMAALSFATFLGDPTIRQKIGSTMGFIMCIAFYAYGATIEINGMRSRPEQTTYLAVIQHKRIDTSQHTRYQLELGPWGPKTGENDLEVSKDAYAAIQPRDMAVLTVKTGLLGVRWYSLSSWDHSPSTGATGEK